MNPHNDFPQAPDTWWLPAMVPEQAVTGHGQRRTNMSDTVFVGVAALLITAGCDASGSEQSTTPSDSVDTATLRGHYTLVVDGTQHLVNGAHLPNGVPTTTTWEIQPCGTGCSRVQSSLGWTADLHLVDGAWQGTRNLTMDCAGTPAPATTSYTLNAKTLTGRTVNTLSCEGKSPIVVDAPAILTKN
ncbi:hypothetical protein [Mycobacteroides abscessus]|uniref:hypothetical protein n=1 Tax=Mycobacteroides abscessus TaxID=36809 RepID=UPI00266C9D93|nr:hypothetical protein [Mycobacteroides abscessus]MDO3331332.1 hypothetical protein [Mycobacteroides abscessus subsp. abscessus]